MSILKKLMKRLFVDDEGEIIFVAFPFKMCNTLVLMMTRSLIIAVLMISASPLLTPGQGAEVKPEESVVDSLHGIIEFEDTKVSYLAVPNPLHKGSWCSWQGTYDKWSQVFKISGKTGNCAYETVLSLKGKRQILERLVDSLSSTKLLDTESNLEVLIGRLSPEQKTSVYPIIDEMQRKLFEFRNKTVPGKAIKLIFKNGELEVEEEILDATSGEVDPEKPGKLVKDLGTKETSDNESIAEEETGEPDAGEDKSIEGSNETHSVSDPGEVMSVIEEVAEQPSAVEIVAQEWKTAARAVLDRVYRKLWRKESVETSRVVLSRVYEKASQETVTQEVVTQPEVVSAKPMTTLKSEEGKQKVFAKISDKVTVEQTPRVAVPEEAHVAAVEEMPVESMLVDPEVGEEVIKAARTSIDPVILQDWKYRQAGIAESKKREKSAKTIQSSWKTYKQKTIEKTKTIVVDTSTATEQPVESMEEAKPLSWVLRKEKIVSSNPKDNVKVNVKNAPEYSDYNYYNYGEPPSPTVAQKITGNTNPNFEEFIDWLHKVLDKTLKNGKKREVRR